MNNICCFIIFWLAYYLPGCSRKVSDSPPPTPPSSSAPTLKNNNGALCLAPAVFSEPELSQLLISPLADSSIATPFFDFSKESTLLLQADIGSGTYMHYKIAVEKIDRMTDGCFSRIEGNTKNASIPGMALHEGKNTVVIYGLCLGTYTITLQSCRDSDQKCGSLYPSLTEPKIYYKQASLLDSATIATLTQYTLSKNATYEKTKEAYSTISQWAKANCITAPQQKTEYCKSASNIVNMGISQYINLVQDHYPSTEATLLTKIRGFSTSPQSAALALTATANDSCTAQTEIFTPPAPDATVNVTPPESSSVDSSSANALENSNTGSETATSTDSSSSSYTSTQLGLIIAGASLAALGSIMWLAGGYKSAGILNQRMIERVETLRNHTEFKKEPGRSRAGKWTALGVFGVALVVIGTILPIISIFTLADTGTNQEKEKTLSQQLGTDISTELKKRIAQEEQLLHALITDAPRR